MDAKEIQTMNELTKALKAERARARKLWKYAHHKAGCSYMHYENGVFNRYTCTCGLNALKPTVGEK